MFSRTKKEHVEKENRILSFLQRLGKVLMYPIAILPFAAIFLRMSALIPDTTQFSSVIALIFSTIGNAVFGPVLPILFAIGVSFGLSRDQRGEAALVGFCAMIMIQLFVSQPGQGLTGAGIGLVDKIYGNVIVSPPNQPTAKGFVNLFGSSYNNVMVNNVLTGILVGFFVSVIYNLFNEIELPTILGFFSGRRLVPILVLIAGLVFGIVWALVFPWIAWMIYFLSYYMGQATGNKYGNAAIMGVFVFFNRLLIPFGMHHIPNTLFWFTLGNFENSSGDLISGDINIFLDGKTWTEKYGYNNAGTFQSGFFPFMMFGLPALAFAFYRQAKDKQQAAKVASLLTGSSLVAFFTGITEPLEFSFMFVAPLLYLAHAILAAFWAFVIGLMQIQIGFGFSAGFIDYVLSIPKSLEIIQAKSNGIMENGLQVAKPIYDKFEAILANPLCIFPVGLLCGASYFYVAKFSIIKFNLNTPGRGNNLLVDENKEKAIKLDDKHFKSNKYTELAISILKAIGVENISNLEWCATRLRFTLKNNNDTVNVDAIKKTSALGVVKIGKIGVQVIIGPTVEMVGNEINRILANPSIVNKI